MKLNFQVEEVKEKNEQLAADKNPTVVLEELIAASLYTGPMYLKCETAAGVNPARCLLVCTAADITSRPQTTTCCAGSRAA